jgi:hypothetical protein
MPLTAKTPILWDKDNNCILKIEFDFFRFALALSFKGFFIFLSFAKFKKHKPLNRENPDAVKSLFLFL